MLRNTEEAKPYFTILGWILIISYIGFYYFNALIAAPGGYENIFLRIVVSACGLLLIFYKYLPSPVIKIFPFIFYSILLFSFPFFFTYMLLNNQEHSAWQVKELVGLILLSFFVDYLSFIVLAALGIGLAFILIQFGHHGADINLIGVFGSYSAPIIYFLIFSKKSRQLQYEKNDHLIKIKELNDTLESKVKTRTLALEKALASKTDFLNSLSHEIRTPIQGFTVLSEGLVKHWNDFNEQKKLDLAAQVSVNAKRLASLLNNLLDLSKFTANKMLMNFKPADLNLLIKDIIDECNSLYINGKSIEIKFNNKCNDTLLVVDKERISQVLRNLFVNAIKFNPDNSIIETSLEDFNYNGNKAIHFSIKDEGIGIPENELAKIFDPFTQSSLTKTKAGGTGLGLSICKEIINAHNGKIWALNNTNNGSSFHFVLPILIENKNVISHGNILMIDDEEVCLNSMELLLMDSGYNLIKSDNSINGLEYLKNNFDSVNVVLLDLMMPDVNGLDMLTEIKRNPNLTKIPIILQTGASNEVLINKAYKIGIAGYLKKPYSKEAVIAEIQKSLNNI